MSSVGLGDVLRAMIDAQQRSTTALSASQKRMLGALFTYDYQEPKEFTPDRERDGGEFNKNLFPSEFAPKPIVGGGRGMLVVPLLRLVEQSSVERKKPSQSEAIALQPSNPFKASTRFRPQGPTRWEKGELAPYIYAALSFYGPVGGVDENLLVKYLSELRPLTILPRASRRRMVSRLRVILDRSPEQAPSWSDGDVVGEWAETWGPSGEVEIVRKPFGALDWPKPEADLTTIIVTHGGRLSFNNELDPRWVEEGIRRTNGGERAMLIGLSPRLEKLPGWWRVFVPPLSPLPSKDMEIAARHLRALASLALQVEAQLLRSLRIVLELSHPEIELFVWQETEGFDSGGTSTAQWSAEVFKQSRKDLIEASKQAQWLTPDILKKTLYAVARFRVEVLPAETHMTSERIHYWASEALWNLELGSWRDLASRLSPEFGSVITSFIEEQGWLDANIQYLERLRATVSSSPMRRVQLQSWFKYFFEYEPSAWMNSSSVFYDLAEQLRDGAVLLHIQHTSKGMVSLKAPTLGSPLVTLSSGENMLLCEVPGEGRMLHQGEVMAASLRDWRIAGWAERVGYDVYGLWASICLRGVELKMRWIEPGTFWMGSREDDREIFDQESPCHQVTLTEGYWVAETPCTQALWRAITGDSPSHFKGEDLPVERVSWEEVEFAIADLNQQIPGLELSLPTEAQWEYACRAGTYAPRYRPLDTIAWYADTSAGETHSVKQKMPNRLGLYDMLGNVWEWCRDWYGPYSSESKIDPTGPSEGVYRVLRGGSWRNPPQYVRAACRIRYAPVKRDLYYGFRFSRRERGQMTNFELGRSAPKPQIILTTDRAVAKLDIWEKPSWASYAGRDEYGLFAVVSVGEPIPVFFRMRWIPPGTFWMGSPEREEGRSHHEVRHQVRLTEGYWLGETPCTQELWKAVSGDNPSTFIGDERPVEQVSWDEIQIFLQRLNELTSGLNARLPTEAQWEYACRAGVKEQRYGELDEVAWYHGNSSEATHPVGLKVPNAWGLHDMLGNVWEWCQDYYGEYELPLVLHDGAIDNPRGPSEGVYRVGRGGSWYDSGQNARAASRYNSLGYQRSYFGFRLSRAGD